MWLREAIALAVDSARTRAGGPFGALLVKNGSVWGRGANRVTATHDPTAHAEIIALREACAKAGSPHLPGAVLYASCEPCPMCFAAACWAGVSAVYFAATRHDAAAAGFQDAGLYAQLALPPESRIVPCRRLEVPAVEPFELWNADPHKRTY